MFSSSDFPPLPLNTANQPRQKDVNMLKAKLPSRIMASGIPATVGYWAREQQLQEPFPLLSLPRELRDEIYRYMVVRKTPILLHLEDRKNSKVPKTTYWSKSAEKKLARFKLLPGHPSLFLVCKMIYTEARPIYYQENVFAFTEHTISTRAIQAFRRMAGSNSDLNMTSLVVFRNFPVDAGVMRVSFRMTCLSDGKVEINIGNFSLPYKDVWVTTSLGYTTGSDEVCMCKLLSLAETHTQAVSRSRLLDCLEAYAGTIKINQLVRSSICSQCGKMKCV